MKTFFVNMLGVIGIMVAVYIGIRLRYRLEANQRTRCIYIGNIKWQQIDRASDLSELFIDEKCLARGSIELYVDGNSVIGNCWIGDDKKIFIGDLSVGSNSLQWYDSILQCPAEIRKAIKFERMKTFEDFRRRR